MKRLLFLSKLIVIGTLLFLFIDGLSKMFFHQDDIILLWDTATNFPGNILATASGHLILFFKPFYFLEWYFFRLHFAPYLAISILIHTLVIFTAAKIVYRLTRDTYWSIVTLLMLVVNVNFYEILWMPSSQMMSLSTLFSLLLLLLIIFLKDKPKAGPKYYLLLFILALLPGLNWGTGLFIPFCLLLAFGWELKNGKFFFSKIAVPLFLSQFSLAVIYLISPRSYAAGVTTPQPFKFSDIFAMLKFVFFGISYSIVGRTLFPLASRFFRFLSVIIFFSWLVISNQIKIIKKAITLNWRIVLLASTVLFGSYFLISLARFQFGLGQAGAPRYAYLPMSFVVIAFTSSLAKINLGSKQKELLLLIVMFYTLLSLGAFAQVTVKWTERPQKNRALFSFLQNLKEGECLQNDFIPWYIVEVDRWTLKDIWPLFGKNFNPFTGGQNCIKINRDVAVPWTPTL